MIQFFAPDIATNPVLPETESQHLVKVLRAQPGDCVEVIDGKGCAYTCELVDAHRKHSMLRIVEKRQRPLPWAHQIVIGVAPTKHLDRMEWLVEKLTEIGINSFIPLLCQRSERREIKPERLEKIAVSAMKQSLKAVLPRIAPMTPVREVIASCTAEQKFICYCADDVEQRLLLARELRPGADVTILVGPEGDFTPHEVQAAFHAGFKPVTLGDNRLRTETAALCAASTIHTINQLTHELT